MPFKLLGRVARDDRESRYQIEADLKDSKITELLPGWWKAAGKATKVSFTAIDKPQIDALRRHRDRRARARW